MFIADISKEIQIPKDQEPWLYAVGIVLLIAGVNMFARNFRHVCNQGGRVRFDLFGFPDVLVAVTLSVMFALLLVLQWIPADPPGPAAGGETGLQGIKGMDAIYGALQFALPVAAIFALLIGRDISVLEVFGLRRVGFFRALLLAGWAILLLLPIFLLVTGIAYEFLGRQAEQQELVKVYQHATKTGKQDVVWQVAVAAVCIAPVTEEFLFRGYIYPVFKRIVGPMPAAFGTSILFAAIHNNALGFPGLTLLALALTLLYERTGSLVVPIFMHAWFNGVTLFFMWWAVTHDWIK